MEQYSIWGIFPVAIVALSGGKRLSMELHQKENSGLRLLHSHHSGTLRLRRRQRKSFTRREYEYALECGVPVAAFLLDGSARKNWPNNYVEHARKSEIDSFRGLAECKLCKFWTDAKDLAVKAGLSLGELSRECPRPGWIKADAVRYRGLDIDAVGSKQASSMLTAAVERDLETAGYYREDQSLDIRVEVINGSVNILLDFQATIIPLHRGARVFHPDIKAPDGMRLDPRPAKISRW